MSTLEKVAISPTDQPKALTQLLQSEAITQAMIVSTCNRVEIYAIVQAFHPALEAITETLGTTSGLSFTELTENANVLYSHAAVKHLFSLASGLQSQLVGEQQILGQLRSAYQQAREEKTLGPELHDIVQRALKLGKKVRNETAIDSAGASLLSLAVDHSFQALTATATNAIVIGAGSMGSLATAQLSKAGVATIKVANRTLAHGQRLAQHYPGVQAIGLEEIPQALAEADLIMVCTRATHTLVTAELINARTNTSPLVICDLGIPHNVEPEVADIPAVTLIDMQKVLGLAKQYTNSFDQIEIRQAWTLVDAELDDYLTASQQASIAPTVTAMRKNVTEIVDNELLRLEGKLANLSKAEFEHVAHSVHRIADKLLHAPTMRMKELALQDNGNNYLQALTELFSLPLGVTETISHPNSANPTNPAPTQPTEKNPSVKLSSSQRKGSGDAH